MMICVPMTTRVRNYVFEVVIAGSRSGVALADQIKSVDWRARNAERKGRVSSAELADIKAKFRVLLD